MSLLLALTGSSGTDASVNLPGVGTTASVGAITATGNASAGISGAASSSAFGSIVGSGAAFTTLTGAGSTSASGTITASGGAGGKTVNLSFLEIEAGTSPAGTAIITGAGTA